MADSVPLEVIVAVKKQWSAAVDIPQGSCAYGFITDKGDPPINYNVNAQNVFQFELRRPQPYNGFISSGMSLGVPCCTICEVISLGQTMLCASEKGMWCVSPGRDVEAAKPHIKLIGTYLQILNFMLISDDTATDKYVISMFEEFANELNARCIDNYLNQEQGLKRRINDMLKRYDDRYEKIASVGDFIKRGKKTVHGLQPFKVMFQSY